jgi:hypothetical protein
MPAAIQTPMFISSVCCDEKAPGRQIQDHIAGHIGICYPPSMSKMIGNAVMLVAGFFLILGGAISIAIIFAYATAVVLFRKLKSPHLPALPAGS